MIKHLAITGIDPDNIERILKKIKEYWTREAIEAFKSNNGDAIYYDEGCDCYVWSIKGKIPKDGNLVFKTAEQVLTS